MDTVMITGSELRVTRIMDEAQRLAQTVGYYGFSSADVALAMGVAVDDIYAEFPSKEALVTAVIRRYQATFMSRVKLIADQAPSLTRFVAGYAALYREALVTDGRLCLCGMLGAEIEGLPPNLRTEVRGFFDENVRLIKTVFDRYCSDAPSPDTARDARMLVAALEGAMLVARGGGDLDSFDHMASGFELMMCRN